MFGRGRRNTSLLSARFPGYSRAEHGSRIPDDKCNCNLVDRHRQKNTHTSETEQKREK